MYKGGERVGIVGYLHGQVHLYVFQRHECPFIEASIGEKQRFGVTQAVNDGRSDFRSFGHRQGREDIEHRLSLGQYVRLGLGVALMPQERWTPVRQSLPRCGQALDAWLVREAR